MARRRNSEWFYEEYDDKKDRARLHNIFLDKLDDLTGNDVGSRVDGIVEASMQSERFNNIHQRKLQLQRILREKSCKKETKD